MKETKIKKIVLAALFAAMTCVATMVIQIPSPISGYVNMGDCFVLLSGWLLGPLYGVFSAALGSMFADVFSGYSIYAPGTFVIKGLVALTAVLIYTFLSRIFSKRKIIAAVISGVIAECIVVVGYYFYDAVVLEYGFKTPIANIPGNLAQAVIGIISSSILLIIIEKYKILQKYYK